MGVLGTSWTSFAADANLNAATIAPAATLDSAVYASAGGEEWEFGLSVAYGTTAVGVTVYLLRDNDGTNFEDTSSAYPLQLVGTPSTTIRRNFTVRAEDTARFKVRILNPTGNSTVTVTLSGRQGSGTY